MEHLGARVHPEVFEGEGTLQVAVEEGEVVGKSRDEARQAAVEVGRETQRLVHRFVLGMEHGVGGVEVEVEGVDGVEAIFQIEFAHEVVRHMSSVRGVVVRFSAMGR